MRHEYLSVYQLENDTINSNTINVDAINVGGGGLVTSEHNLATDGHVCGSYSLFTISGDVRVKLLAVCNTLLAGGGGGAQVTLGFNGALTNLIGQTTATGIDAGEQWTSSTIANNLPVNTLAAGIFDRVVTGYTAIKLAITSASGSTGVINFYCWWEPISTGATVVAS
jgi:hypothetical protein